MLTDTFQRRFGRAVGSIVGQMETAWKWWTRPTADRLLRGALADLTRSRRDLIAENAFLRQQIVVLKRQKPRPNLTRRDRTLLVLLAAQVQGWKDCLFVVKPDTLLKWHRAGFRLFWREKSKGKTRVPKI